MSTTAIIASTASTNAAVSISMAAAARKDACIALMSGYSDSGANVQVKQHYAECVQLLHPPNGDLETLAMKIAIVSGFVIFILVAVLLFRKPDIEWAEALVSAIIVSVFLPFLGLLLFWAVTFLFS